MRVLHVTAGMTADQGGPPRAVEALCGSLARRGLECTVYAPAPRPVAGEMLKPEGTELRFFPRGRLDRYWPGYSPAMARALKKEIRQYDIVHIHELWHYPHYAAASVAGRVGVPYVASPHGTMAQGAIAQKRLKKLAYSALVQKRLLEGAAAVHAMTIAEAEDAERYLRNARVSVIPFGVDIEALSDLAPPGVFERNHPQIAGKRVVLFMGRLNAVKGLDILIPAFTRLAAAREDLFLVIAGPDDGYGEETAKRVRESGQADRIILAGILEGEERLAALARANVFVLPSYGEGFSVAILEALAAGCPVVITHGCNFPEVADTGAGMVVNPEVKEVSEALGRVLDDAELARRMSGAAKDLIREKYDQELIAANFVCMYRTLCQGSDESVAPGR